MIGRKSVDVTLQDPRLSRQHGKLWVDSQGVWYQDLGSQTGSWTAGARIEGPILLDFNTEILVGDTRLKLLSHEIEIPEGMQVRLEGRAGRQGLSEALGSQDDSAEKYVSALYDLTESLFHCDGLEGINEAIQRVGQVVPLAQSLALVAWPPGPDGRLRHLADSQEPVTISTSLAHYAVAQGRALLLTDTDIPKAVADSPSMQLKGIRSAVCVPLQGEGEQSQGPVALLCVESNFVLPLSYLDFQFLCAVAGVFANKLRSERLRKERALVEARREGLATFLQIASHDLKNPLTAISNCVQLLRRVKPERHAEIVDIIQGASARANDLIRTYLDAAAVESGKTLAVERENVDIARLVDEEIEFLKAALGTRMEEVEIVPQVDCPPIWADGRKLRQIVSNLLSNAVKYSPARGVVQVQVWHDEKTVYLSVKDQGVGISEQDQQRLFTPFQRVGDTSRVSGTGLGLWLTAALIQAHGGQISVESAPGSGSIFRVSLPRTQQD